MTRYGSDLVVDWLGAAGVEYAAINPGASFRGLHDSLVRAERPRPITVLHEEVAVGIAHGYAKAAGRPMAAILHNLVGLQHGSMALFNAYVDNVPILVLGGSGPRDIAQRRPWLDWIHSGNPQSDVVRDIVKWHAEPASLEALAPSLSRGYRAATTVPMGPVYLSVDAGLQEADVPSDFVAGSWPASVASRVVAPAHEVERVAHALSSARRPVLIVDRPAPGATDGLVRLAEATGAAVVDLGARCTFPSTHWADQTFDRSTAFAEADLVIAFEARDIAWAVTDVDLRDRSTRRVVSDGTPIYAVGMTETQHRGFLDRESIISGVELVTSDVAAFVDALLAVLPPRSDPDERVAELSDRHEQRRKASWASANADGAEEAITVPWLAASLWEAVRHGPWQLANGVLKDWPRRLWDFSDESSYLGRSGGEGLGYGLPASIGAALAATDTDRLVVDIQSDGDLLYTASALWTLAHHRIPLLVVVYNNRRYGKDHMHQTEIATHRGRGLETVSIGIDIDDPAVDFASLASAQGVEGVGPVREPRLLPDVLVAAARTVREEKRAIVVDVMCPGS